MAITYYQANRILNRDFGGVSFAVPSTLYFGLSTTVINSDGTGATEPSGGSYARASAVNDKTTWSNASSASLNNLISISFPESSASWGTITYVFIIDAASSGNMLYFDTLSPSRAVASLTTVLFAASAITISMPNT